MKEIKWASDIIKGNLCEARKYILKAYELQDTDKAAADWCKSMAAGHMDFNKAGHTLVTNYINAYKGESELLPGMKAVYDAIHAEIVKDAAEIQSLISTYK